MTVKQLFQQLGVDYHTLPRKLDASTCDDFVTQFRAVFSGSEAKEARGVVYVWSVQTAIPRVRGQSKVLYIGQTIQTLCQRWRPYARRMGKDCWDRYNHIIATYGPISVNYATYPEPRKGETRLLLCYFEEHFEYPPAN